MSKYPRISVIMSVYNTELYLNEAIDSILNQTYKDFEFLIIDDASTDNSLQIINRYQDKRIKLIKNKSNIGLTKSLNKGITLAKGEYIARMDADDISILSRFEKQLGIFKNSNIDACFSTIQPIDKNGGFLKEWISDKRNCNKIEISNTLVKVNCLAHPSVMIKANLLKEYLYDEKLKKSQDYNLWLRLVSAKKNIYKIEEDLVLYRIHSNSISFKSSGAVEALSKNCNVKYRFIITELASFHINYFILKVLKNLCIDVMKLFKYKLKNYVNSKKIVVNFLKEALIFSGSFIAYITKPPCLYKQHRITFFFPGYNLGGAEKVHIDIVSLATNQKPIVVFTSPAIDDFFLDRFKKVSEIIKYKHGVNHFIFKFVFLGYWSSILNRNKQSVVFGCNSKFYYQLLPHLKSSVTKIDLLHAFGSKIEDFSLPFIKYLDSRVVINKQVLLDFIEQYKSNHVDLKYLDKIQVIENAVYIPSKYPLRQFQAEELRILYVGRDSPEKRIHLIGEVAVACKKNNIACSFKLIGNFSKGGYKKFQGNCTFLSPQEDLSKYYKESDVILITSSKEGFPMVIMEAMAYGVIPICTNVGGLHFHIKNYMNGFLVENDNEENIIQKISSILNYLSETSSEKEAISKETYLYAKENFNRQLFEDNYRNLLK